MKLALALSLGLTVTLGLIAPPSLDASQRWRTAPGKNANFSTRQTARPMTIAYGTDRLQTVDYWRTHQRKTAPLIIFVHGGGWERGDKSSGARGSKLPHFLADGYNFASIDYRLAPQVTVEQEAADVAAAVKSLLSRSEQLGIDTRQIILMGHSAGAHLVALVSTDPRYLAAQGLSLRAIRGSILLDGAAYDVPRQIKVGTRIMESTYQSVFGGDLQRQREISPTYQALAPNVANFLILHIDRADGTAQSNDLAAALRRAGTAVNIAKVPGTGLQGHAEINRRLGDPSYPATAVVDRWLAQLKP